jgi:transposase
MGTASMIKTSNSVTSRLFPGCEQRERHLLGGRPVWFRQLITRLTEHLKDLDQRVDEFETQIKAWHRSSELSMKLEKIPGIGPLGASALVASIADATSFDNGR